MTNFTSETITTVLDKLAAIKMTPESAYKAITSKTTNTSQVLPGLTVDEVAAIVQIAMSEKTLRERIMAILFALLTAVGGFYLSEARPDLNVIQPTPKEVSANVLGSTPTTPADYAKK